VYQRNLKMDRASSKVLFISYVKDLLDQPGKFSRLVPTTFVLAVLFKLIDPNEELDHRERVQQ
jgi:hypothetical protein